MSTRWHTITLAITGCALLGAHASAQQPSDEPTFAAPRRIEADDKLLGEGRLFPSPVLHDMDDDGLPDIVVGDLMGRVTWARRLPGDAVAFAAEEELKDRDGSQLKFQNW